MAGPIKILVIEDDLHTRNIITKVLTLDPVLRSLHPQLLMAADGEEGVAQFQEHHPQLVITDLLMPRLDGFKVVERIRSEADGRTIPIIVTSAVYRDKRALGRLINEFRAQLLPKPFSPKALAQLVLDQLRASLASPSAAEKKGAPRAVVRKVTPPSTRAAALPTSTAKRRSSSGEKLPSARISAKEVSSEAGSPEHPRRFTTNEESGAAPRYLYSGSLGERPLPALLLEILEQQLFGTLELEQGKVRKLIHIMSGHPIFVQSNLRGETLGQMLIRRGGITGEQHGEVLERSKQDGIKYGEALVRLGLMTEGQVMDELLAQTRLKIESCLRWSSGTCRFVEDPSIGAKVPRCIVDPVEVVFEGLKRYPNLDEAFARFAEKGSDVVEWDPRLEQYRERFGAVFGRVLLDVLVPGASVSQIIARSGAPQEAVLQCEALLQAGLIHLAVAPAGGVAIPLEARTAEPIPLEQLMQPEPALNGPSTEWTEPPRGDDDNSAVIYIPGKEEPAPALVEAAQEEQLERTRIALQLIQATYLGLHDATYYEVLGVSTKSDVTSIEVAYRIKRKQFDLSNFRDMDLGAHYGHLEEICATLDEAFSVLASPQKRAAYDKTLPSVARPTTQESVLKVENLIQKGQQLFAQHEYQGAAETFAMAIKLDEQAELRAMHARSLFYAAGATTAAGQEAMAEIEIALTHHPSEPEVYLAAVEILRALERPEEAIQYLRQLISVDPSSQQGFDELEQMFMERGELETLEIEYRRAIYLASQQDPYWAGRLWHRLALFYQEQLHDEARARMACEAALKYAPKSRELCTLLAGLNRTDPVRWPEAVLGYRSLFRSDPRQPEPLFELWRLHLNAGRTDAAFLAASAAVACGLGQEEHQRFWEEHSPSSLQHASRPLEPSLWESLRHVDDDPGLSTLFRVLAPLIQRLHPLTLAELGLRDSDLIAGEAVPPSITTVLGYVTMELGVLEPRLAVKQDLGLEIQSVGCEPPLLLFGPAVLELEDPLSVCFLLGRAMSTLSPGRMLAAYRSRRLLRSYILATLAMTFPRLNIPEPDSTIDRIAHELDRMPDLLVAVKGTMTSLHKRFNRLNLSDWQKGMQRTADRVGLLLSTDLVRACRFLPTQDQEAELDLVDFALSETYGELRESLGLALV